MPAAVNDGDERGYIIPIGGSEDKNTHPVILKRVLALAGGREANIVILPTASRLEETGLLYERIFTKLGAGTVSSIPIATRSDCNNPEFAERCAQASGIFLTGGNHLRLSSIMGLISAELRQALTRASGLPDGYFYPHYRRSE